MPRHAIVRLRAAAVAASIAFVAACGAGESSSTTPTSSPVPPERQLTCGGKPFPPSALSNPVGAELSDTTAAQALRDSIVQLGGPQLGVTGPWRILTETDTEIQFATDLPDTFDNPMWVTNVREDAGVWRFWNGGECTPRPARDELAAASWQLPPGTAVEPSTRRLSVWVTERECNSGEAAGGRIQEPDVAYKDDAVTITFWVTPRPGVHACPGNPPTPYELTLDEPLGQRQLLDGGTYPPRPPADPHA